MAKSISPMVSTPVPAPATAEILKDVPLAKFDVQSELTTPTGAAFAKSLVSSFGPFPSATMKEIGYGAGVKTLTSLMC